MSTDTGNSKRQRQPRLSGGRRAKEAFDKKLAPLFQELQEKQVLLQQETDIHAQLVLRFDILSVHAAYTQHYILKAVEPEPSSKIESTGFTQAYLERLKDGLTRTEEHTQCQSPQINVQCSLRHTMRQVINKVVTGGTSPRPQEPEQQVAQQPADPLDNNTPLPLANSCSLLPHQPPQMDPLLNQPHRLPRRSTLTPPNRASFQPPPTTRSTLHLPTLQLTPPQTPNPSLRLAAQQQVQLEQTNKAWPGWQDPPASMPALSSALHLLATRPSPSSLCPLTDQQAGGDAEHVPALLPTRTLSDTGTWAGRTEEVCSEEGGSGHTTSSGLMDIEDDLCLQALRPPDCWGGKPQPPPQPTHEEDGPCDSPWGTTMQLHEATGGVLHLEEQGHLSPVGLQEGCALQMGLPSWRPQQLSQDLLQQQPQLQRQQHMQGCNQDTTPGVQCSELASVHEFAAAVGRIVCCAQPLLQQLSSAGGSTQGAHEFAESALLELADQYLNLTNTLALVQPQTYHRCLLMNMETLEACMPPPGSLLPVIPSLTLQPIQVKELSYALSFCRQEMASIVERRQWLCKRLSGACAAAQRGHTVGATCTIAESAAADIGLQLHASVCREAGARGMLRHFSLGKVLCGVDIMRCVVGAWPFLVDASALAQAIVTTLLPLQPAPTQVSRAGCRAAVAATQLQGTSLPCFGS